MNLSDKDIKSILNETRVEYKNDLKLENDIMASIDKLKTYELLIQQNKKIARIGLYVCIALFIAQLISLFYSLISTKNQMLSETEMLLPSLMVLTMWLILFILIQGSKGVWVQKTKELI